MNHSGSYNSTLPSRTAAALALVLALCSAEGLGARHIDLEAQVVRVLDGDTMKVRLDSGKTEVVRFWGIDAPESYARRYGYTEYLGRDSARFTRELLQGKRVRLQAQARGDEPGRDRYRRILAFVYHENRDVCALLVEKGLARVYRKFKSPRHAELVKIEDAAREKGLGIWNAAEEKEFYRRQYRRNRNRKLVPWFREHDPGFLDDPGSAGKDVR